jgi:hypothetical protein
VIKIIGQFVPGARHRKINTVYIRQTDIQKDDVKMSRAKANASPAGFAQVTRYRFS